jgi:site-specific DNA recombinase
MSVRSFRCAVYTRKSTEDGLEQDFNSLHAQREACEAYIRSQASEGWQLMKEHYDDGGISGATMERPALKLLLAAIAEGKVDIVVVYKIDRLTRSLMDFARMVELFDKHQASFVSVTQQFNTTTSMGRLTLNVLLSFAQFEREVTAERIRDKIAASKKKGMWMGGPPPLGYDVQNRQLVINETEAKTVRTIYRLYLNCDGVSDLKENLDRQGIHSKIRTHANGKTVGGVSLSRGMLYRLLSNPVYIGRVSHKHHTYEGQHDGIIPQDLWDAVQRKLADNRANRTSRTNASHPSLLAGLLYDETGDRLTPTHANNHGKRYRFYISHRLTMQRRSRIEGWRLPAFELEKAVLSGLAESLRDPKALADLARLNSADAVTIDACTTNAGKLADQLQAGGTEKTLEFLRQVISRIEISPGNLKLEVIRQTLRSALCGNSTASEPVDNADIAEVQLPFQMRRRGVEAKLMMAGATPSKPSQDTNLVQLIQDVHRWIDNLIVGQVPSIDELAEHEGIPASEISRTLQLAFLAPDLMKSILLGTQPADLTTQSLKRLGKLPACWREQRRLLGMQGQSCSAS